ncbi:MAG: serine hydrolase [Thermoguttaceae bacterium]
MNSRRLATWVLVLAGLLGGTAAGADRAVFPAKEWEVATPQSQGLDGAKLEAAIEYLREAAGKEGVRRMVVVRNGRIVWRGPESQKAQGVWSVTKAFTSTAHGLLIEEGKCTLDTLAKDYDPTLTQYYPKVTLRHLATMTSGIDGTGGSYDFDDQGRGDENALVEPLAPFFPPGTKYMYWDEATQHYGYVLTRIAGESLEDYLKRKVLDPIGITQFGWKADKTGKVLNWTGGIEISAEDLARFGLLYLHRGNWNGRQLVPAKWVDEATRVQVPPSIPDALPKSSRKGSGIYGYHWWPNGTTPDGKKHWPDAPPGTYGRSGYNNNDLLVVPEWNMVIVRLGLDEQEDPITTEEYSTFLRMVGEAIRPSMLQSFLDAGMPDEILFAVRKPSIDGHWYANIAYYSTDQCRTTFPMNSGGKLCIYNVRTGQVRTIFEDPEGNIRDPQIHYGGKKLIFAYLPKGKRHYSLYEINLDGTGLVQLTGRGEDVVPGMEDYQKYSPPGWDDFEPTYLPDGQIIFCSTRANRYVQCWMTQVGTLYKCDADGGNIRALSANIEQDNTPWVLANGQVAYMRWEYVDRFHMGYHHLWSMNPDGTRQMVLYGNQINTGTILAPKPVPNSPKLVVTWSPGHGMREHYGRIALVDPRLGPDDPEGVRYISQGNVHCDPWAFSENHILVANKGAIELLDGQGKTEVLHQLPPELVKEGFWIGEPRPVMGREPEPAIADQTNPAVDFGTLALANIYQGRKMRSVAPGTVKNLLVYEVLPKPINYAGAMSEMSAGGTFSVERLIGSVPVSEDGSACFRLPALRSFLFLAMDEKGHCVKRMHSFTSVMPGETTTCVGCHEKRTEAPSAGDRDRLLQVMNTRPVDPEPVPGVPEIFDYLRDIQPILDRHCLECHNHDREEGGFNISGHWGPLYPIGYIQMSWRELFGDNRIILPYAEHSKSNFEPYEIGTGSSRLLKLIEEGHEGVKMPEGEQKVIRHWLDAGANHAGTYAVNSHGTIGFYELSVNVRNDKAWPETQALVEVMTRRCDGCHAPTEAEKKIGSYALPAHFYARYYPADEFQKNRYVAHTMSEDGGRHNRHLIYNLSYPELSKAARSPLAKAAGGLGVCEARSGQAVFKDQSDGDYRVIVAAVARGRRHILEENNRFSMINASANNGPECPVRFVPRRDYVREMIRYGVLPVDHDFGASVDPFALDQAYWKTFWYVPK